MKHSVAVVLLALTLGNAACASLYRVELAYFDLAGGPLLSRNGYPLPDGCLGQVIADMDGNGIATPLPDGTPGSGDCLVTLSPNAKPSGPANGCANTFRVNGQETLGAAGFFLCDPGVAGDAVPRQSFFLRVWDAADPEQATAYYDSPLFHILPGFQQVSFLRHEWCMHEWPAREDELVEKSPTVREPNTQPEMAGALRAYPNPFNSATRVCLALPETGKARVAVFDLQGRQVASLADGILAAGKHELLFDARALPSGMYFVTARMANAPPQNVRILLVR